MEDNKSLNVKALELNYKKDAVSPHMIYYKEHIVREHSEDKPSGRTLFVFNIPPYVDEEGLREAFKAVGKIKSIQFCNKPNEGFSYKSSKFFEPEKRLSFRYAYVVFAKVAQIDKALSLRELKPLNDESQLKMKCGIHKWIENHNNMVCQQKEIKEKVETFMKKYDNQVKTAEEKDKKLQEENDEGWITVTKRGKIKSFARSEKVENKIKANEEKHKKRKELKNFYTFQIRESKMKHIVSLRQKYEEDKKKIAQLKQSRSFKPF